MSWMVLKRKWLKELTCWLTNPFSEKKALITSQVSFWLMRRLS
jgi:hypothetical protein